MEPPPQPPRTANSSKPPPEIGLATSEDEYKADPTLPKLSSEILGIYGRSSNAEGNPFHICFSRNVATSSHDIDALPTAPASANPAGDPSRAPIESIKDSGTLELPSGKIAIRLLADGIAGSADWHRDRQVTERMTLMNPTDRSVLIQTREHLADLAARFPALAENFSKPTPFGENLLIAGDLVASQVCIGDIIHIVRPGNPDEIVGVLQVSNPRLPCYKVDHKHRTWTPGSSPMPALTVRGYCAETGHAGFFCRVLRTGSLSLGDRLVIAQRLLPQWTLAGISKLMYGGVNARQAELRKWLGTEEQLHELMELKLLGWFEWRHALHKFVEKHAKLEADLAGEQQAEEGKIAAAAKERADVVAQARLAAHQESTRRVQIQVLVVIAVSVAAWSWTRM